MPIDSTSNAASTAAAAAAATTATAKTDKNALGKDAFMNLLVTQLQHQDPTKPMDDTAFLSQLAQFSSLEQLQQMNTSLTTIASFYNALGTGTPATGAATTTAATSTGAATTANNSAAAANSTL